MPTVPQIGLSPPVCNGRCHWPIAEPWRPQVVGQTFEGMFASMLLKQMRQSLGGSTMFGDDKSDALGGLFDHFIGQHMASGGGLGVGAMVRHQLESRSATNGQQQPQRIPAAYAGAALPLHRTPEARSLRPGVRGPLVRAMEAAFTATRAAMTSRGRSSDMPMLPC